MTNRNLVHRVSLLLQKSHHSLALIFILFRFCSSCLLFLVLILILYRSYLLWHQNKIEFTHVGDQCLSPRLVIGSDNEPDPEYVPPGTATPSRAARAARATPKKVASNVVTASQSDEERTLTGTPSKSATHEEGASVSLGVLWSQ